MKEMNINIILVGNTKIKFMTNVNILKMKLKAGQNNIIKEINCINLQLVHQGNPIEYFINHVLMNLKVISYILKTNTMVLHLLK
jgi:hypothetical protein